jgi:hypothetical protein
MECPAVTRKVGHPDKLMRLESAPRRNIRLRGRIVGKHLDHLANRHLADPLGQHDDRQRALAPKSVDAESGLLGGARQSGGGLRDQVINSGPGS